MVWARQTLFDAPMGAPLVFKGGTSLSKAYGAIQRFSEDVDLTYDIRALVPDLVGDSPHPLPASRSQEKRWTREIRERLTKWTRHAAAPFLAEALRAVEDRGEVRVESADLLVCYAPLKEGTGYVSPEVKLEFGARATGEPNAPMSVVFDAAPHVPGIEFPKTEPRVMRIERTFWEKATAAHVYCLQHRLRGERFARHWYDLARLDAAGYAESALANRALANAVAAHKAILFSRKGRFGKLGGLRGAVSSGLKLVPTGASRAALADDYTHMIEDGLLPDDAETFDALMTFCEAFASRVNQQF